MNNKGIVFLPIIGVILLIIAVLVILPSLINNLLILVGIALIGLGVSNFSPISQFLGAKPNVRIGTGLIAGGLVLAVVASVFAPSLFSIAPVTPFLKYNKSIDFADYDYEYNVLSNTGINFEDTVHLFYNKSTDAYNPVSVHVFAKNEQCDSRALVGSYSPTFYCNTNYCLNSLGEWTERETQSFTNRFFPTISLKSGVTAVEIYAVDETSFRDYLASQFDASLSTRNSVIQSGMSEAMVNYRLAGNTRPPSDAGTYNAVCSGLLSNETKCNEFMSRVGFSKIATWQSNITDGVGSCPVDYVNGGQQGGGSDGQPSDSFDLVSWLSDNPLFAGGIAFIAVLLMLIAFGGKK